MLALCIANCAEHTKHANIKSDDNMKEKWYQESFIQLQSNVMRSATSLQGWRMNMIERHLKYKQIWVTLSGKNRKTYIVIHLKISFPFIPPECLCFNHNPFCFYYESYFGNLETHLLT